VRAGSWQQRPEVDDAERLALELAERATVTPPEVDDAFIAQLQCHFSAPQIVEMAAIVAWENYRARLNCILGIEGHYFFLPEADDRAKGD
jgi:alkylhydroperoxidase family enzyme